MTAPEIQATSQSELERIFELQHDSQNLQSLKNTGAKKRIAKIRKIERYLMQEPHLSDWTRALEKDLRKSREEAITSELATTLSCMRHIYRNLKSWMRDSRVGSPLVMMGMSSRIQYEPKGHVLIMAPWNYPLLLVINPLIHAIAAGNAIIVKPSEMAPATASFLKTMIADLFEEREIALVEGDAETAKSLLEKPFHHIFFTGSPRIGKLVMKAASEHLTSVTLELGGKSPVLIDQEYDLKKAAEKIAWAKCLNAGQTCIAPDYAVVHESNVDQFVTYFRKSVNRFYDPDGAGIEHSPDYVRIVNQDHFQRLSGLIDQAVEAGADLPIEGNREPDQLFMSPFVITGVTSDMKLMKEEIFGPVLPIVTYKSWKEIPHLIKQYEKPLALYIMSHHKNRTRFILQNTSSGGVGINELLVTIINPALPFGGVNHSGIGKSNGRHGFIEFSNERGVVKRNWLNFEMIYPPYNKTIINWLLRIVKL